MKKIIGIVLAMLVMYVWGFAYWAVNPMASTAMLSVEDDAAAQQALASTFKESGTYFIPGDRGAANHQELHRAGPIAVVRIRSEGAEPMAPMVFVMGAVQYLIGAILLAAMLGMVSARASQFQFVVVFALAASYFTQLGEVVWFLQSASFPIFMFIYEFVAWLLAGLVLMKFVPARD